MTPDTNRLENWLELIEQHLRRYSVMTTRDVYKLLYQGVLGPEHIMPSAEIFTTRLREELAGLQPDPVQPLFESIRPDGALQRIHLRPWLAGGQDISQLVEACLSAGQRQWGAQIELRRIWQGFLEQAEQARFPDIPASAVREFNAWLHKTEFPAAHHSTIYRTAYQPAYRLVSET